MGIGWFKRLIDNNWVLSESDRTKNYLNQHKSLGNHFPEFMESVFTFETEEKNQHDRNHVGVSSMVQTKCLRCSPTESATSLVIR